MLTADGLCYLTGDEPGIGGILKGRAEDFVVDEVPLFEPEGRGDHLYLLVEKRQRLTTDVVRFFSKHFGVPWRSIGYAGFKDKRAVTTQWFSIEHAREDRAAEFSEKCVRILDVNRHPTKLKRGNLSGNRFDIKIRGVTPSDAPRAKRILDRLAREGAPNFLGEQRFGYKKRNHLLGRALIQGDLQAFLDGLLGGPDVDEYEPNRLAREAYDAGDYERALQLWPKVHRFERQAIGPLTRGASPAHAVNAIDKPHLSLLVSAFQSAVFNALLHERILDGRFATLEAGDLAFIHASRGVFAVEDPAAEQPRCDRLEISPTGPMWGRKMTRAQNAIGAAEERALIDAGLSLDDLSSGKHVPDGSRRVTRMLVKDPQVSAGADERGPFVRCAFELGRGSFATIVMREIMKTPTLDGDDDDHDGR